MSYRSLFFVVAPFFKHAATDKPLGANPSVATNQPTNRQLTNWPGCKKKHLFGAGLCLALGILYYFFLKKKHLEAGWVSLRHLQTNSSTPGRSVTSQSVQKTARFLRADLLRSVDAFIKQIEASNKAYHTTHTPEQKQVASFWKQQIARDTAGNSLLHCLATWSITNDEADVAYEQFTRLQDLLEKRLDIDALEVVYNLENNKKETFVDILALDPQKTNLICFLNRCPKDGLTPNDRKIITSWKRGKLSYKPMAHSGQPVGDLSMETALHTIEARKYRVDHFGNCTALTVLPAFFELTQDQLLTGLDQVTKQVTTSIHYTKITTNKTFRQYAYKPNQATFPLYEPRAWLPKLQVLFQQIKHKQAKGTYHLRQSEKDLLVKFVKDLALLHRVIHALDSSPNKTIDEAVKKVVLQVDPEATDGNWWMAMEDAMIFLRVYVKIGFRHTSYPKKSLDISLLGNSPLVFMSANYFVDYLVIERIKRKP